MGSSATLDYQSGRVDIRQDVDDATTLTIQVEASDGSAYDLSAGTYADSEGLFTVDDTDAATGILVLTATGQDAGTYPFLIRDTVGEIAWLSGYLLVGGVGGRRTGSSSATQTLTVDDGTVTVQVATAATVPSSVARGDGTLVVGDLVTVKSLSPLVVEGLDRGTYTPAFPFPVAARYGPPGVDVSTNQATLYQTFRGALFPVYKETTFAALGARVTSAGGAGSVLRIGIYRMDVAGDPELEYDAGTLDGTTVSLQEIAANFTLAPGLYAFGGAEQGSSGTPCSVYGIPLASASGFMGIRNQFLSGGAVLVGTGSVTGAFPATLAMGLATSGSAPYVFARKA